MAADPDQPTRHEQLASFTVGLVWLSCWLITVLTVLAFLVNAPTPVGVSLAVAGLVSLGIATCVTVVVHRDREERE